jgi:hypothetical protein
MSATATAATAATAGPFTGEPPSAGQVAVRRWRSSRYLLLSASALILLAVILAALRPTVQPEFLDPASPSQGGGRALAQLLEQRGVRVQVSRSASDAASRMASTPGSTLMVVRSERLTARDLETLGAAPGDLLLVRPDRRTLERLVPGVRQATQSFVQRAGPGCRLPAAVLAGQVDFQAAHTYETPGSAMKCYADKDLPRLVQVPVSGRTVTVLGSGSPLTNEFLAKDGDAALGMNLAGARSSVVWLVPGLPKAAVGGDKSFMQLVPFGVKLALLQLLIAVALAALWRSRRLGPVVLEPLPVIVRSAETVEGRARLYRARHARDSAADALRAGARERLVPLLGLARGTAQDPAFAQEIVTALAGRARLEERLIGSALYGPAPADDAELVRLSDFLDDLERQVRQS